MVDGSSRPLSPPASPSRDVTDFQMPSLYHFSAVDAASAVDYSRDVGIDDGVVNSPPPPLVARAYAPSPSPLSKEKRTLVRLGHLSPSKDDGVTRRGPSRRLRMEGPRCHTSPADSVPPPATSSAIVGPPRLDSPPPSNIAIVPSAPDAPVDAPLVPTVPRMDVPKAKVPSSTLNPFPAFAFLVFRLRAVLFTSAHPKPPSLFSPLHSYSYLPMTLFRRWLPARLVPGPPPRPPWIGTPSRPHLPSPIVVWPSGEAQDVPFRKHPRILLIIPPLTIRERVLKHARTTHIPFQATHKDTVVGLRFLEPWRPPKKRA